MTRATLATRVVYRCLLRAVVQRSCPEHRARLLNIVRAEFRCPEMAREGSLDDALAILRNLTRVDVKGQCVRMPHPYIVG